MKDAVKSEWEVRPLGEVCKLINGRAYKKPELLDDGPYPVLRVGNFFTNNHWCYSDLELDEDKYCDDGDLLYAWSASFGPRIWTGGKVIYHYHIWKVVPSEMIDRDFLYYFFDWDKELIKKEQGAGTTMIHVSKGSMEARAIPLPPLEEQQRIVAVLDEAFEGLTRARANAEANLKNARELFESAIAAALERAGGEPVSLQKMMDAGMITSHLDGNHGGDYPRKEEFVSEGVPYISANCIAGNEIDFGRCKYLTPERADGLRKGIAKNRDVLFAHNATVGPVTLLKTDEEKVILSTSLTYYRCNEDELIPEFLVCEMRSAGFRRQYEAVMAQATRNQVPITMQRKFTHLIPPLAEQRRIAELGVELEAMCNSAIKSYEASLQDLYDLRQSLLQKAFAGKLT